MTYGYVLGGPSPYGWRQIRIGNGGLIIQGDAHSDGTKVVTTDSFGGYVWDATANQWQQLLNASRMPNGTTNQIGDGFGAIVIDPSNSSNIYLQWQGNVYQSSNKGATITYSGDWPNQTTNFIPDSNVVPAKSWNPYMAVDPANSNIVYSSTASQGLFRTTNGGTNWTVVTGVFSALPCNVGGAPNTSPTAGTDTTSLTVGTGTKAFANNSANFGFSAATSNWVQVWSASDPTASMFGQVSVGSSGTTFSLNVTSTSGSGTKSDWNVSGINFAHIGGSSVTGGGHRICFDVSGGTVTAFGQTVTKNVYVHTYNVGTYFSSDGGVTWTAVTSTGRPSGMRSMRVDKQGALWCVTDDYESATTNCKKYTGGTGGTWSYLNFGIGGITWYDNVAIDIANSGTTAHVVFTEHGHNIIAYTDDAGATWTQNGGTGAGAVTLSSSAADVAWIDSVETFIGSWGGNATFFDPSVSGRLYNCGEGVYYTTPAKSGGVNNITYTQQTRGIEEFISVRCVSPNSGSVILTTWDIPGFYTSSFSSYPSGNILPPGTSITQLEVGLDVDWLWSNPNRVVCNVGSTVNNILATNFSSVSSDGGQSWTQFATQQTHGSPGGFIAISDTNTWVQVFSSSSQIPKETTDGGTTWSNINIPGISASASWGTIQASATTNRFIDSDKANGNIYLYCVNDGSTGQDRIYKRTFGNTTWSTQMSLGIGVIARFNGVLKSSGVADCLFMTPGLQAAPHPGSVSWYFTTDGWSSVNSTVTGFKEVQAYGFGAKFPGSTFPTIFAAGWYTGTALINGSSTSVTNAYGIWMCKNLDRKSVV